MDPRDYIADLEEEVRTLRGRAAELEEELRQIKEELRVANERKVEEVSLYSYFVVVDITNSPAYLFGDV